MSKNHRPIAPIRPALTHLRQTDTDPWWQQWLSANKIVLVAAAGVIAIASIALGLASRYQTALPEGVIGQQGPRQSTTTSETKADALAPFAQLTQAQAQQTAQDQLARFVELQLQLEQSFTDSKWAAESLTKAKETALLGDTYFQNERYREAFSQYQSAGDELFATIERGNAAVAEALKRTNDGIDQLDQAASQQALSQARAFFPKQAPIDQLQARVDKLPEVSGLLRQALNLELAERYAEALEIYKTVADLDPATRLLTERVAAAQVGLKKQRIRQLLGTGFRALEQSQFTNARSAFLAVLKEQPNNAAALGGIEQIGQLFDVAVIKEAESAAAKAMKAGDWNQAISAYQNILDLDKTIQIGIAGRTLALEHQRITDLINAIRSQPERLSSTKLFNDAERAVAEAKALPYQTPLFTQAIEQVRSLLKQYRDPVRVTLISDNAIEISLSNVGSLGPISERTLTLRPGKYTLRGSKDGCRDIYTEIVVLPDIAPIEVFCAEVLP